jgi:hypothetical protein
MLLMKPLAWHALIDKTVEPIVAVKNHRCRLGVDALSQERSALAVRRKAPRKEPFSSALYVF